VAAFLCATSPSVSSPDWLLVCGAVSSYMPKKILILSIEKQNLSFG